MEKRQHDGTTKKTADKVDTTYSAALKWRRWGGGELLNKAGEAS